MKVATKLVAAILAVSSSLAAAADLTITWQHPTELVDATPIPASGAGAITQTRIEYGTCTGTGPDYAFGTKRGEVVALYPAATATVTGLAAGARYCFRGYTKTTVESGPSNVVAKWVPATAPKPPVIDPTVNVAR
jgi:hypothetical protein